MKVTEYIGLAKDIKAAEKKEKRERRKQRKTHNEMLSIHYDNLTSEQRRRVRTQLTIEQDGCCAICADPETDRRQLSLDHCHTTGHIRGLLCGRCNTMLGFAKDNVYILQHAVKYLTEQRQKWSQEGL